jgi:hypothetical protein
VAEPVLDHPRVLAGADHEGGGGVPEAVEGEMAEPGRLDGRSPDAEAEVGDPERAAGRGGEDQVGRAGPAGRGQVLGQHGHEERGDGQRPAAGRTLGRRGLESTADLGDGLGHGQGAAEEVEMADAQPGDLRPPETKHARHVDDRAVLRTHEGGEPVEVLRTDLGALLLSSRREPDAPAWVT